MADFHYIARQDYRRIIESRELLTLIDNDPELLKDAERMAVEQLNMFLRVRYDLTDYFKKIYVWDSGTEFKAGDLMEVQATEYDQDSTYTKGDSVSTLVFVYRANRDVLEGQGPKEAPLYWDEIGQPNIVYEAIADNTGQPITNTEAWRKWDSRNPFLVTIFTDLVVYHLMSRSGQIPDIRVKRYDDAITTIKAIASGKVDIGLPLLAETPRETNRIAMRSGFKQNSFY